MFTLFAVAALALSASAQKDDKGKRPPKNPPQIPAPDKNKPRENPPKGDQKPKKPGMEFVLVVGKASSELA